MYQNKTLTKLQQLSVLGFEEERMDDFYQIFMDAEYEALGLNDFYSILKWDWNKNILIINSYAEIKMS